MTNCRLIKLQRRLLEVFGGIKANVLNSDSSWSEPAIRMQLPGTLAECFMVETCSAHSATIIRS